MVFFVILFLKESGIKFNLKAQKLRTTNLKRCARVAGLGFATSYLELGIKYYRLKMNFNVGTMYFMYGEMGSSIAFKAFDVN